LLIASLLCAAGIIVVITAATPAGAAVVSSAAMSRTAPPATGADAATPAAVTPSTTAPSAAASSTAAPSVAAPSVGASPSAAPAPDWDSHHEDGDDDDDDADSGDHSDHDGSRHPHSAGHHDNQLVNIGEDSTLAAGKHADSVVSIFGNTRVEGTVGDDVVAVFGNSYIDGKVDGDAVAVFGNVELGPHAEIDGDVVTVGGKVRRDAAAIVNGDTKTVFGHDFGKASGITLWVQHCLMYGRPLSLAPGLGWAWELAFSLLALYVGLALVFRDGVTRCAETFERQPGHSVLAALLAVLLTPVLIVLLCITVVGIAAVPFIVMGLFCVTLFAKTVILAWLGRRVLRVRGAGDPGHPALAVLIGGLIALALYLVPVFGFVVYKLLGFLGFGAVVYTVILGLQARQAAKNPAVNAAAPAAFGSGSAGAGVAAGVSMGASPGPAAMTDAGASAAAAGAPAEGATGAGAGLGAETMLPGAATSGTVPPNAVPPRAAETLTSAVAAGLPRAGFWIRMAALLIDVLLVGFVASVLHPMAHVHVVLLATYGAIMWKLRGSTVGGIVFDLRVVRVDGREMDWETTIIRALSCFLSLAVVGLGFFWIAFDDERQAWHDKIAGTVVVRVPKAISRV